MGDVFLEDSGVDKYIFEKSRINSVFIKLAVNYLLRMISLTFLHLRYLS